MSGIATPRDAGDERSMLAAQLREVASATSRAAVYADGEYIPQMSRAHELHSALVGAARAGAAIDALRPSIRAMQAGEFGIVLAQQAYDCLIAGQEALKCGSMIEEDLARGGGTAVADAIGTGAAGRHLRAAQLQLFAVADLAQLEATPDDELVAAITGRAS